MSYFNDSFSDYDSNDSSESVDEHIVKFKGRSNIRQYVTNKPIKWGFKF